VLPQDYSACRWPEDALPGGSELGSEATAAWLDAANEQQPGWSMLQRALAGSSEERQLNVISFSHFLPHQHLLPEKRMLTFPNLVSGWGGGRCRCACPSCLAVQGLPQGHVRASS
jgi:hypothetical protein